MTIIISENMLLNIKEKLKKRVNFEKKKNRVQLKFWFINWNRRTEICALNSFFGGGVVDDDDAVSLLRSISIYYYSYHQLK